MADQEAIKRELQKILPVDLKDQVEPLAKLINDLIDGKVTDNSQQEVSVKTAEVLGELIDKNKEVKVGSSVIEFTDTQTGDISIRDVTNGTSVHINLPTPATQNLSFPGVSNGELNLNRTQRRNRDIFSPMVAIFAGIGIGYFLAFVLGTYQFTGSRDFNRVETVVAETVFPVFLAQTASAQTPTPYFRNGSVLERVKARRKLLCGVNKNAPGFSVVHDESSSVGIDADYCIALQAAIGVEAVSFISVGPEERFTALLPGPNGEEPRIDVLFRNSSKTGVRDVALQVEAGPTYYYDDQRIMVHNSLAVTNTVDFERLYSPSSICVLPKTTSFDGLVARFGNRVEIKSNYTSDVSSQ